MAEINDSAMARSFNEALQRVKTRLHEAEVNAPPQVYQAVEKLKEMIQSRLDETEEHISQLAHDLGESEEDLIEWLKLDIRTLEKRLLQGLINASDSSRAELKRWLEEDKSSTD